MEPLFSLDPNITLNITLNVSDGFCSFFDFAVLDPTGTYLNLCFVTLVIIGGVDLLGLALHIFYAFTTLRKFTRFKARVEQGWIASIMFFVKLFVVVMIAFQWTFTKLAAKTVIVEIGDDIDAIIEFGYPLFLVAGDIVHMTTWLLCATILYLEWDRSLPHWLGIRLFWIISAAASAVKLHSLVNLQKAEEINFWNNREVNYGIQAVYVFLAVVGAIGAIPSVRKYIEADPSKAQAKKEEEIPEDERPAKLKDFLKLVFAKGRRTALLWLLIGITAAASKGYIMQSINTYDGRLFNAARDMDTSAILETLQTLALLYGLYSLGSGLAMLFSGWGAEKIINGTNGIRNTLFRHLLDQEMAYHDKLSSGVISSRFSNDAERVKMLLAESIPQFLENTALVIFGMIFLFSASWSLTLYMLGLVPLVFGANYYQAEKLEAFLELGMMQTADMSNRIQEVFSKYTTVLTYGKQAFEIRSYNKLIDEMYRLNRKRVLFSAVLVSITGFLAFGTQILAFFLGVELFHIRSFGEFITFCLYAMNVVMGLIELVKIVPILGETIGATGAVVNMLERKPNAPEASKGNLPDLQVTDGEIQFKDVVFAYPNNPDKIVLNGISFKISKHSKVALVGDSGAGKSTILQLIARFYDPISGQILIDGQDIRKCNVRSIRDHIGMVRQDSDLFATTVLENIAYGRGDPDQGDYVNFFDSVTAALQEGRPLTQEGKQFVDEIMFAAEQASAEFVQNKLTLQLGEGGKGLSGGQKQRVTIARALYKNPQILLLDEVTSALDQVSEAVVQKAIDRLVQDRTVLIVAHRLHTIQNADKIIVLSGGKIVAEGTHDELMVSSSKYRDMVTAAKRDEESKVKDTKTTKAIALLKEIYDVIRFDAEFQPLSMKIKELVATTEEQAKKIERAAKLVEQASELARPGSAASASASAAQGSLLLDLESEQDSDDGMSTDSSSTTTTLPARIEERPAPPPPDDDDEY